MAEKFVCFNNFLSSRFGDSQLVRLSAEADTTGSYIQVLDNYTNIGPVLDMCVMDVDKQGQMQLVTCSGAFSNGSLRIIRSGVGIHEHASIDLPGTKAAWAISWKPESMSSNDEPEMNNVVVLSFIGQTRFLLLAGESDPEEIEVPGLTSTEQTLFCGNVAFNQVVQITASGIFLLGQNANGSAVKWRPPNGRQIGVCSCNGSQIVCASGSHLYYLEIGNGTLDNVTEGLLDCEVACIDIGLKDTNVSLVKTHKNSWYVTFIWRSSYSRIDLHFVSLGCGKRSVYDCSLYPSLSSCTRNYLELKLYRDQCFW